MRSQNPRFDILKDIRKTPIEDLEAVLRMGPGRATLLKGAFAIIEDETKNTF